MIKRDQEYHENDIPQQQFAKGWSPQEMCYQRAQEDKQKNGEKGIGNINKQSGGLDLVSLGRIFRKIQEFDHRVAEQSLFGDLDQGSDGQEQRPDPVFFRRNMPYKYEIANDPKNNNGKPVQQGEKKRLRPESRY